MAARSSLPRNRPNSCQLQQRSRFSAEISLWLLLPLLWPILSKMSPAVPKHGYPPRPGKKACCKRQSPPSKWFVSTQAAALPTATLNQWQSCLPQARSNKARQQVRDRLRPGSGEKRQPFSMFAQSVGQIEWQCLVCAPSQRSQLHSTEAAPLAGRELFVLFHIIGMP